MPRLMLRDDPWERLEPLLPGKVTDCGVTAKDNRRFIEAVLWGALAGSAGMLWTLAHGLHAR